MDGVQRLHILVFVKLWLCMIAILVNSPGLLAQRERLGTSLISQSPAEHLPLLLLLIISEVSDAKTARYLVHAIMYA